MMKRYQFFKPIFVAGFFILSLESIQLLLNINYYPNRNSSAEKLALVALVFIVFFLVTAAISAVASLIVRSTLMKEAKMVALVEALSVIAMALIYTPAFIFIIMKHYPNTIRFFWSTNYAILPVLIILGVILSRVFLSSGFKRVFYNLIDFFWKPALIVFFLSVVWLAVFMVTGRSSSSPAVARQDVLSERPNVIFITFDALSANHMSLYGYQRKTTPFWEKFAKESYVFQNMHSNFHLTQPTLTSILTSKYPWTHGVFKWMDPLKTVKEESIMAELGDEYRKVAIVPSMHQYPDFMGFRGEFDQSTWIGTTPPRFQALSNLFLNLSISRYTFPIYRHFLFLKYGYPITRWDEPFDAARKFIDQEKDFPYFLWVHLWPPHVQNHPPLPFLGTFLPADQEVEILYGAYTEDQQEDVDRMRARYDEVVLFTDDALKGFIKTLKETGEFDKSIIIVSADHGEMFKGGYVTVPSPLMYEAQFHVPLLIHLPGQRTGVRVKALAEQIDLGPTILDLLNKPIPGWMEGESLLPYMKNPTLESERTKYSMILALEHMNQEGFGWWFSAYWRDYKLIYHMNKDAAVLFKVVNGHQVEVDLSSKESGVFRKLKSDLNRKIDENYGILNSSQ